MLDPSFVFPEDLQPIITGNYSDLSREQIFSLLPTPSQAFGNYVPVIQVDNLVLTSGTLPVWDGQVRYSGPLGSYTVTESDGQAASRLALLNALSAIHHHIGSWDRWDQCVKVTGFVNSTPRFTGHPAVINGVSDLLVYLFGDRGRHARSAVGVASLPLNASVEIELVIKVHPAS